MYGTIARIRIKKDSEGKLRDVMEAMESRPVAGFIASYVYRLDGDPQDMILAVVFADRDTYHKNANDPAQDAQFQELRKLLERDPEWNDGEIIWNWPRP